MDRVQPGSVPPRQHPARSRRRRRTTPRRLLPSRWGLRRSPRWLAGPHGVPGQWKDLDPGNRLGIPEPERRGRLPAAPERASSPRLQRQLLGADPPDRGVVGRRGPDFPAQAEPLGQTRGRLCLSNGDPDPGRTDPGDLHRFPEAGDARCLQGGIGASALRGA